MPVYSIYTLQLCSECQTAANAEVRCVADGGACWPPPGLPWVVAGLGISRREHQLPEDGGVERTEDPLVEVDDSPKGRPQLRELRAHQPEGRGQHCTPFSLAALQHGLEGGLHPLSCSCVCVCGGGGEAEGEWGGGEGRKRSQLSAAAAAAVADSQVRKNACGQGRRKRMMRLMLHAGFSDGNKNSVFFASLSLNYIKTNRYQPTQTFCLGIRTNPFKSKTSKSIFTANLYFTPACWTSVSN